jgi:hypothetical protein
MMTEATTNTSKPEVVCLEKAACVPDNELKASGYGLVKSRFDELSISRTLWVFRRVVFISLAVYTGYVCEGFEVSDATHPEKIEERSVAAVLVIARRLMSYSLARAAVSSRMLALSSSLEQQVAQVSERLILRGVSI